MCNRINYAYQKCCFHEYMENFFLDLCSTIVSIWFFKFQLVNESIFLDRNNRCNGIRIEVIIDIILKYLTWIICVPSVNSKMLICRHCDDRRERQLGKRICRNMANRGVWKELHYHANIIWNWWKHHWWQMHSRRSWRMWLHQQLQIRAIM